MPRGAEVSIPKGFHPPTDFKSVSKAAWIDAAKWDYEESTTIYIPPLILNRKLAKLDS